MDKDAFGWLYTQRTGNQVYLETGQKDNTPWIISSENVYVSYPLWRHL